MLTVGNMDYIKTNPVGIDKSIQQLQLLLNYVLEFDKSYGRVYKIDIGGRRIVPAYMIKGSEDYVEVLTDDRLNGSFFFIEGDQTQIRKDMVQLKTEVDIIFQMNLSRLEPEISHRADEEMRLKIMNIISGYPKFEVTKIIKGIDALRGFYHNLRDMQPYHYLKISGLIRYQNINC